ncbi:hypothetical protein A3A68_02520 [Candidatus Saccharibacteria bacterium RIFCSPLOWO2_01_FULL_48_13]|nr:MAG: hypothetical protein A2884_00700 [Candidatus Saccharibacteria bacterium RIFCSPHIGHO2_01_FULL_48_12]OGL35405.1 MAG: hypothetical protein A3F38_00015 [Candidatus Saccharibacteria bacterium RIFCSPHIGHO2_12_FULL_48_21]OGL37134.1 MAG: hypothetical protein A3A68_02520 [Candidatus Saccharibacteria bacterium RIFCSPLOWO2_01_FULL_48_13]
MRRRAEDYPFYDISGPIPIVHRGGNAVGPGTENTVEAFWSALQQGIGYGEVDVCGTIDNKTVAIHGTRNPFATRGGRDVLRSWIARHTRQELIKLPGFEQTPLLEEVLTEVPDMRFFIDLKTPEAIKPTAKAIDQLKVHDRVSVGTDKFGREVAAEMNGGGKDVCVGVSGWGAAILKVSGVTSVHLPHFALSRKLIDRAHDSGIRVITWPKNPEKNDHRDYIESSLDKGVYGVKSDHTKVLVDVFQLGGL